MKERRKLERFDLRLPATIEVAAQGESEKTLLYVMTKDVCAGGAFFDTLNALPKDTQVKVGMALNLARLGGSKSRRARIKVSGRVLRSEPTGMAIGFDKSYKIIPVNNI